MTKDESIHEKHRQRVYQEIQEAGLQHLPEHRVLEYMLFFCMRRGDTNPLAHALIEHFGSLASVLEASEEQLRAVKGVGPATARFLHAFPEINRYYLMSKTKKGKRLDSTEVRVEYLLPLFRGLKTEAFYMIALDERAKLIKSVLLTEGSSSSVQVSVPKLIHEASLSGATCVILAHNHPGKVALPSQNDIEATGNMMRALGLIEVRVLDHIIIANEEYYSMFDQAKMPFYNMRTGELRYY